MKKLSFCLLLAQFASVVSFAQDSGFKPGELLVMLKSNDDVQQVENDLALMNLQPTNLKSKQHLSKRLNTWLFEFNTNVSHFLLLDAVKKHPSVIIAQSNHYVYERATPNDAQFGVMWDMHNIGQSGGIPDADIDAVEAWDITTGGLTIAGDTIVVAVVDNGFSLSHQDLNFWKNYDDIPGNSIDDDGNGYVDDYNGWNAYNNNGTITSATHGTHVSGTVGARGNNSVGVTGVNWNVKVMPVQGSSGTESTVVLAYSYVLDARALYNSTSGAQGAFVVSTNASFGVDAGQPSAFPIWCAIYDSLGMQGILSAGATANQNWDIDAVGDIPTACPSPFMISVTNTTRFDMRNTGAAYGLTTIDLGAPGTSVTSTTPGNNYASLTGTSMATPHVAGAVALMWAAACLPMINDYRLYPDSLALILKNYMLAGTDPLTNLAGMCVTGGRLNMYNALLNVQTYNCITTSVQEPGAFQTISIFPNPSSGKFYLKGIEGGVIEVYNVLGERVFSATGNQIDLTNHPAGIYFVRVQTNEGVFTEKVVIQK